MINIGKYSRASFLKNSSNPVIRQKNEDHWYNKDRIGENERKKVKYSPSWLGIFYVLISSPTAIAAETTGTENQTNDWHWNDEQKAEG